ncbi:hypothetical protein L3Q82_001845 [Scortum barcoo]|uniref:Uncharacterized protein n=1 Tax=Scortum barcoo TaxID=214431 RepID=A0ACB8W7N7_9TELE|nr:hypothetical protein L3Q82_001845 [Scortum barcoo]
MVKEKEWSHAGPLKATACSICSPLQPGGPEPLLIDNNADFDFGFEIRVEEAEEERKQEETEEEGEVPGTS